jgi:hypothetical protein
MEKIKKYFQAQELKMADESNMAAKIFFLIEISKKTFLLYFLTDFFLPIFVIL